LFIVLRRNQLYGTLNSTLNLNFESLSPGFAATRASFVLSTTAHHTLFTRQAGPFNKVWLEQSLKRSILSTCADPTHFSGHSFHRGAANSAITAGISKEEVKDLWRWRSNAVDRYLTPKSSTQPWLSANCKLHLATLPQHASLPTDRHPAADSRSPASGACNLGLNSNLGFPARPPGPLHGPLSTLRWASARSPSQNHFFQWTSTRLPFPSVRRIAIIIAVAITIYTLVPPHLCI